MAGSVESQHLLTDQVSRPAVTITSLTVKQYRINNNYRTIHTGTYLVLSLLSEWGKHESKWHMRLFQQIVCTWYIIHCGSEEPRTAYSCTVSSSKQHLLHMICCHIYGAFFMVHCVYIRSNPKCNCTFSHVLSINE